MSRSMRGHSGRAATALDHSLWTQIFALPNATVCPLANENPVAMADDEECRGWSVAFDDVTFWKTRGASCADQSARSGQIVEWRTPLM